MDSRTAKKISKEIIYNLEIVLSNKDLSSQLSTPEFRKNIIKQLSMLKQLFEIQKAKESELFDLIDIFNLFLKDNKIQSSEIIATDYKEESEFLDESNYLKVFISNTFSRPFDLYSHNDENLKKLGSLETMTPVVIDKTNSTKETSSANSSAYNYNAGNQANGYQYGDPNVYKEKIKMDMINRRILEDFNKGNYYFYTSKPKIIPILKKISAISTIILGLVMLSLVSLNIATFSMNIHYVINGESRTFTFGGINWISFTLTTVLAIWIIFSGYKQLKPIKNDNYKYYVNNFGYWLTFIFGFIFFINVINYQGFIDIISDPAAENSTTQINVFKAWVYMSYVVVAIFLSNIIYPILNNVYRPQDNRELKTALIEKYSKEIDDLGILK